MHRTGCGRRFAVVSNLRRHYRVHFKSDSLPTTPKIPAVQRIRQVQQLMERVASSSSSSMMSVSTNASNNKSIHKTTTTIIQSGTSTDPATTKWDDPIRVYGIPEVTCSDHQHTMTRTVPQYDNNMSIASLVAMTWMWWWCLLSDGTNSNYHHLVEFALQVFIISSVS